MGGLPVGQRQPAGLEVTVQGEFQLGVFLPELLVRLLEGRRCGEGAQRREQRVGGHDGGDVFAVGCRPRPSHRQAIASDQPAEGGSVGRRQVGEGGLDRHGLPVRASVDVGRLQRPAAKQPIQRSQHRGLPAAVGADQDRDLIQLQVEFPQAAEPLDPYRS